MEASGPEPAPASSSLDNASEVETVRERRCGRCQLMFPGDPGAHATAKLGFWMCPPCHSALLDGHRAGRS